MSQVASGCTAVVERGPSCMFIRLQNAEESNACEGLAEGIWNILRQHLTYCLVLEMEDVEVLPSVLIGQLVMLHKRIAAQGGILRLSGLHERNRQVLQTMRLDLPHYANRSDALLGPRRAKPRSAARDQAHLR